MISRIETLFANALDTFNMNSIAVRGTSTMLSDHCSNQSMLGAWSFRAELLYFTLMRTRLFGVEYVIDSTVVGQIRLQETSTHDEPFVHESLLLMVSGAAIQESISLDLRARSCEFVDMTAFFDTNNVNGDLHIKWPTQQQIMATRLKVHLKNLSRHLDNSFTTSPHTSPLLRSQTP